VDEFRQAQAGIKGPGVAGWWEHVMAELSAGQSADLVEAGKDRRISHRAISVVLGQWGFEVTPAQVGAPMSLAAHVCPLTIAS
jgi:hypothetical protein